MGRLGGQAEFSALYPEPFMSFPFVHLLHKCNHTIALTAPHSAGDEEGWEAGRVLRRWIGWRTQLRLLCSGCSSLNYRGCDQVGQVGTYEWYELSMCDFKQLFASWPLFPEFS